MPLGATRTCPHCKSTVLASAGTGYAALQVEGTVRHKQPDEPCEFCVVLSIANERGEQITRQVVGVGLLQPAEARRFSVSVNLVPAPTPLGRSEH